MQTRFSPSSFLLSLGATALILSACGAPAAYPSAAPAGNPSSRQERSMPNAGAAADGEAAVEESAMAAPLVAASGQAVDNAAPPPQDMYFDNYGVNGFTATAQDNLSTFAVDVDTGSYTVARTYLTDGWMPPADSIRVEEFVNYFDYGYPLPSKEEAFNIVVDGAPSPFYTNDRTRLVRIGIQGYDIAPEDRPDVALTFVIDVSGSMDRENRLGLVKRALTVLVDELRPTDSVAVVVYGSRARLVLPMTDLAERDKVLDAIRSLQPDGSTNAEEGLQIAYEHAWQTFDPKKANRIVLASDGVANVGNTGPDAILETIGQYAVKGLTLTSVGVGMGNYNDVLMEQLADQGDGFYAYVDGMDEARKLFVEDLPGTLLTIARDAKVQVEFDPAVVERYRLIGYENRDVADDDFRNDDVDAGEIGAGHSVTALYEIELAANAEDGPIATVRLRWEDPESSRVTELEEVLTLGAIHTRFTDAPLSFQLATAVSEFAENLRQSDWTLATLDQVQAEAQRINDAMEAESGPQPAVIELVDLIWAAAEMEGEQGRP